MGTLQSLIDSGVCVLYHDYRSSTFRDWSGNGNDGMGTGAFTGQGYRGAITVPHDSSIDLTTLTAVFFTKGPFLTQSTFEVFGGKQTAINPGWAVYTSSTVIRNIQIGADPQLAQDIKGSSYLGFNLEDGAPFDMYKDGRLVGSSDIDCIIESNTEDFYIAEFDDGTSPLNHALSAVLLFNRVLTDEEHENIYCELQSTRWPKVGYDVNAVNTLLQDEALIAWHDYRSGTLKDFSGNGNDGVLVNSANLQSGAVTMPFTASVLEIPSSTSLNSAQDEGCFVHYGEMLDVSATEVLYAKYSGGNGQIFFVSGTGTSIVLQRGGDQSTLSATIDNTFYRAVNHDNGVVPTCYLDGEDAGSMVGTPGSAFSNSQDVEIGNLGGGFQSEARHAGVMVFNRQLTDDEHRNLYGYLASARWPSRTQYTVKDCNPNELVDGDMEAADTSAWTAFNGQSDISKVNSDLGMGSTRSLRVDYIGFAFPRASQTVLEIGAKYNIKGWAKSDGNSQPSVLINGAGIWTGVISTEWQYFDVDFEGLTRVDLGMNGGAAGYTVEFDNVQVTKKLKTYPALLWSTDWGTQITSSTQSSGFISNSPFKIESGLWAVEDEDIDGVLTKVIRCVSSGVFYVPTSYFKQSPTEAAQGAWRFKFNKSGGSNLVVSVVATAPSGASADTLSYNFIHRTDETIDFREVATVLIDGGATVYPASTWHEAYITRSAVDEFELFVNDESLGTATDSTYTEATVLRFDIDSGDKIGLAGIDGTNTITKELD